MDNKLHQYKAWDEITYPFPNLNGCTVEFWDEISFLFPIFDGCTVEIWERVSSFIPHITEHVATYPRWDLN